MRRWDNLVEDYVHNLTILGNSPDYVLNNRRELERWGQWLKRKRPRPKLEQIDGDLIIQYIQTRSAFKARTTLQSIMSKMRCFGDFLVSEDVWPSNALRWIQGPKLTPYHRMPKRISTSQMQSMWEEAAKIKNDFQRYQWITILSLLYGTGLRRGELERLTLKSWDRETSTLIIDGRKTGSERSVVVPGLVHQCIETYLPYRQNQLSSAQRFTMNSFFLSRSNNPIKGSSISRGVRSLARQAGFKLHSVHQFRHTCASDLLESGVGMAEVQQILGHGCLDTTMRYLHIADPQRHEAVALHPLNDWLNKEVA